MTLVRTLVLSALLLTAYWSHLVSFGILAGTIGLLAMFGDSPSRRRTIIYTVIALLPVVPLLIMFKSLSAAGEGFSPQWRSLGDVIALRDWIVQIVSADPFVLISRRTIPFWSGSSRAATIFAPVIWLAVGLALFAIATLRAKPDGARERSSFVYLIVLAGCLFVAAFGPDDFGLTNGGILRERLLICGLLFFIPLIRLRDAGVIRTLGTACLVFVFLFQTAAVWDYALTTDRTAREFLSATQHIPNGSRIASVVVVRNEMRFHPIPEPQLNNLNGIGRDTRVWDNYELGYYMFPIVAVDGAERAFAYEWSHVYAIDMADTRKTLYEKLNDLHAVLARHHGKIDILVTWDIEPSETSRVLDEWFEPEPYFTNNRVRMFRHR